MRHGVKPIVFNKYPEIGGLLTFGIPEFKLEKSVLTQRRQVFIQMGVVFRLSTQVGRDITLEALLQDYDTVFMGMGAHQTLEDHLPGESLFGTYDALFYLRESVNHNLGYETDPEAFIPVAGKRVVILGGGYTAMACARTVVRQGTTSVTCAYQGAESDMPGSRKEMQYTREERIVLLFNRQPLAIVGSDKVEGVKLVSTRLGDTGADDIDGDAQLEVIADSEEILPADMVLIAFGFKSNPPWLADYAIALNDQGGVAAFEQQNYAFQTSNPEDFCRGRYGARR